MFTGLISEIGSVTLCQRVGRTIRLAITAPGTAARLKPGDSVAVAGACLTVEHVSGSSFDCIVIPETVRATRLSGLRTGEVVNLELALAANDRFGGHLVTGHVDCVGRVTRLKKTAAGGSIAVSFDSRFDRWVVEKGSLAIDGVSLTVAARKSGEVTMKIIPTTWQQTTIGGLKPENPVNVEFDQALKAIVQNSESTARATTISAEFLSRAGW